MCSACARVPAHANLPMVNAICLFFRFHNVLKIYHGARDDFNLLYSKWIFLCGDLWAMVD